MVVRIEHAGGGRYIAYISLEQRHEFKRAGWIWDSVIKKWTTVKISLAAEWADFAVGDARPLLQAYKDGLSGAVADSMAHDADIGVPSPEGLDYAPFQRAGISYALQRKDTLIADPPGTGKTIQAIGINNAIGARNVLVLCPAYLKLNWKREYERWDTHGRSVGIVTTVQQDKLDKDGNVMRKESKIKGRLGAKIKETVLVYPDTDVVIINDALMERCQQYIKNKMWDSFIADECEAYKNPKAARSQQVWGGGYGKKRIPPVASKRRTFLTGTPLNKNPLDMWVYCKHFDPRGLGSNWRTYMFRYCDAYESDFGLDVTGSSNLEELNFKMREAFMVRRDKIDIMHELPPKRREIIMLADDGILDKVNREVNKIADLLDEFKEMVGAIDLDDQQETLDAMLTLFPEDLEGKSYAEIAGLMTNKQAAAFDEISLVRKALAVAKVPMVKEHVSKLVEFGEKVIVFAHHNDVADALRKHFPDFAFISGKVPAMKRQAQVDRLQDDPDCPGIICTIGSGGVGFTMTAARYVVFSEMTWLPTQMEQAEDRAWRWGQDNNVVAQYLVVNGSLDARFMELLVERMDIIERALSAKKAKKG